MLLGLLRGVRRSFVETQQMQPTLVLGPSVYNLPDEAEYNQVLPWLSKVAGQTSCKRIAADFFCYYI